MVWMHGRLDSARLDSGRLDPCILDAWTLNPYGRLSIRVDIVRTCFMSSDKKAKIVIRLLSFWLKVILF